MRIPAVAVAVFACLATALGTPAASASSRPVAELLPVGFAWERDCDLTSSAIRYPHAVLMCGSHVRVYRADDGQWLPVAELPAPFPGSVGLMQDRIVVVGPAAIHSWRRSAGTWVEDASLEFGEGTEIVRNVDFANASLAIAFWASGENPERVLAFALKSGIWKEVPIEPLPAGQRPHGVWLDDATLLVDTGRFGDGKVHVYGRSQAGWQHTSTLPRPFATDRLSAVISGDRMVIGARAQGPLQRIPGGVRSYARSAGTWTFQQDLHPPDHLMQMGHPLDLSDDRLVVGASHDGDTTRLRTGLVYDLAGDSWVEVTSIHSSPELAYAESLHVSGGRVYWRQPEATPDGAVLELEIAMGSHDITAELGNEPARGQYQFADQLCMREGEVVIGLQDWIRDFPQPPQVFAPSESSDWRALGPLQDASHLISLDAGNGRLACLEDLVAVQADDGHVHLLSDPVGTAYNVVSLVDPDDTGSSTAFGWSVARDGDVIAIGAPSSHLSDASPARSGVVHVYERTVSGWTHVQRIGPHGEPASQAWFGASLAFVNGDLAIGAPGAPFPLNPAPGFVEVYTRGPHGWQHATTLLPADARQQTWNGNRFGLLMQESEGTLWVGAPSGLQTITAFDNDSGSWTVADEILPDDLGMQGLLGPLAAHEGLIVATVTGDDGITSLLGLQRTGGGIGETGRIAPPVTPAITFGDAIDLDADWLVVRGTGSHPGDAAYVYPAKALWTIFAGSFE